jgi:predicted flap endonuclease-1-like 5' DNA nuclease
LRKQPDIQILQLARPWRHFFAGRTVPAWFRGWGFQMLAAWNIHAAIAALVAFLLGWLFTIFFWKKGKTHEEVLRRVVETSTDESTRLKTLADEHSSALKLKDDALLRMKSESENELVSLRADRDKALADVKARENDINTFKAEVSTHKAEATKLQGLVGTVDTSKKEIDDLRAQLAKQKGDYEGSLSEWRVRAEKAEANVGEAAKVSADWQAKFAAVEAAKVAAEKRVVDLDASHARVVGEWQSKVAVAEQKQAEVQGLMGSAKADNDKVLAEWRTRAEKAEGELGNWSRRYAELEASNADWDGKYIALEADRNKINADWDGRYKALEADRNKVNADWQSRFAVVESAKVAAEQKHVEVQGLLGSTKADSDKVLAEWRTRTEKAEADAAAAAKVNADWDGKYKALEADRNKINADWEGKYKALEADRNKINADWDGRYKALEADRNKINADWDGKYKALEADRNKINADWQTRYQSLETTHSGCAARLQAAEAKHVEVQGLVGSHQSEINSLKGQLAEATAGPDDLKVIEGIGPKIDQALRADGLTRWIHIRDASQDRLKSAIEKGGVSFAPSMTTWSKQAAYLVAGDQAGFKQYTEYLVSGQDPAALGGEVLTGAEQAQALAGGAVYGSGNVEVEESPKNKDGSDNLLIIEGVGPKFNDALKAAGLGTFAKVAAASEDQLRDAIKVAGLSFAPSLTSWAEQADLLNKGDMDSFRALTARLIAGRKD